MDNSSDIEKTQVAPPLKEERFARDDFMEFRNPNDPTINRLVEAIERAYFHPWKMAFRSFIHGMMVGIGGAFGTALVVFLSGYLFTHYGGIDKIKGFLNGMVDNITQSQTKSVENSLNVSNVKN